MYNYNINIVLLYIIINIITLRVINHSIPQRMTLSTNIHLLDEMVASFETTQIHQMCRFFRAANLKKKKRSQKNLPSVCLRVHSRVNEIPSQCTIKLERSRIYITAPSKRKEQYLQIYRKIRCVGVSHVLRGYARQTPTDRSNKR